MTLKTTAETTILEYVPMIRQTNAVLFDEHREFVELALKLLRDRYQHLKAQGAETYSVEPEFDTWFTENKPY